MPKIDEFQEYTLLDADSLKAIQSINDFMSPELVKWMEHLATVLNRVTAPEFMEKVERASVIAARLECVHEARLDLDRLEKLCERLFLAVAEVRAIRDEAAKTSLAGIRVSSAKRKGSLMAKPTGQKTTMEGTSGGGARKARPAPPVEPPSDDLISNWKPSEELIRQ